MKNASYNLLIFQIQLIFSDPSIINMGDKRPVQQNIKLLVQLFHNFSII
jgi:hypothetical protein